MLQQTMMWVVAQQPAWWASNWLLNNLVSFYELDSTATDSHWSEDLTATNITWDTTIKKNWSASADANGTTSYLSRTTTTFASHSVGTIAFWLYPDSVANAQMLFDYWDANANRYIFVAIRDTWSGNYLQIVARDKWAWASPVNWFSTWSRQHVTIVQDGVEPKIYLDWTEETGWSFTDSTDKTAWFTDIVWLDTLSLARYQHNSASWWYYNWRLDDVGIWSSNLDSTKITALQTTTYSWFTT